MVSKVSTHRMPTISIKDSKVKFNGKFYYGTKAFKTKTEATDYAAKKRKSKGLLARVVTVPYKGRFMYGVFVR